MPVSDEITLSNIYSGKSDFLYEITDFKTGRYKYQVNFSDLKAVTDVIFIFASIYKGELTILESKNININDTEFIFERPLVREYGHRYYIGLFLIDMIQNLIFLLVELSSLHLILLQI